MRGILFSAEEYFKESTSCISEIKPTDPWIVLGGKQRITGLKLKLNYIQLILGAEGCNKLLNNILLIIKNSHFHVYNTKNLNSLTNNINNC